MTRSVMLLFASFASLAGLCFCGWKNGFDRKLDFSCPPNNYIYKIFSKHSNTCEDRKWDFGCRKGPVTDNCYWTGYRNEYDAELNYKAPWNTVITGMRSIHSNKKEDRRYAFRYCKVISHHNTPKVLVVCRQ